MSCKDTGQGTLSQNQLSLLPTPLTVSQDWCDLEEQRFTRKWTEMYLITEYKSPLSENVILFTWAHGLEEICAAARKRIMCFLNRVLPSSFICPNVQLNHTLSPFHIQKSSWVFSRETSRDLPKPSNLWLWKFYLGCWLFPKLHFQLEPHVA